MSSTCRCRPADLTAGSSSQMPFPGGRWQLSQSQPPSPVGPVGVPAPSDPEPHRRGGAQWLRSAEMSWDFDIVDRPEISSSRALFTSSFLVHCS